MAIHSNCHGTPRLSPRQFPRTSIHCNFHGKPRHSAAKCHGNPPIRGNCHGTSRQLPRKFRGRQTTAISTAFRDNCIAALRGNRRQLPRQILPQLNAISTAINGNCHVSRRQFPCNHGRTAIQGNCHDKRRDATGTTGKHGEWRTCQCPTGMYN